MACSSIGAADLTGSEPLEERPGEKDGPIIPVLISGGAESGWPAVFKAPDIPRSIVRILKENIRHNNTGDPYYFIQQELSEKGFNAFRLIQALNSAIRLDNIELVKEIFKYYTNFVNGDWSRADMRVGAATASLEMIKFLFDSGLDLDRVDDWSTGFSWFASYCPNPDIIRYLIERGEDINQTTTYCGNSVNRAAEFGMAENLRILLEAGASFETLNYNDVSALMLAGKSGNAECVKLLLDAGADIEAVDYYGNSALMEAAASGSEECVRLLLKAGAGTHINRTNQWGSSALIEAAINGNGKTVEILIAGGADVNSASWSAGSYAHTQWYLFFKGLSALMLASTADAAGALISGGADINIMDSNGNNAIFYQCFFYRNAGTVAALIKAGSYLYLDINKGRVLLRLSRDYSDWEQNPKIITMLERAGCIDKKPEESREPFFHVDRH
jgi:ankyrin repeat protein